MAKISQTSLPEVFLTDAESADKIYRLKRQGLVRQITGKLYTSNMQDSIENIISRRYWEIVSLLFPNAVIADRSTFELKTAKSLFLISDKSSRPVTFGEYTIYPRKGIGALKDDTPFMGNLFLMSEPRKFLENMRKTRIGKAAIHRYLTQTEIEEKLDAYIRTYGEDALNGLRDKARELSTELGLEKEFVKLNTLIGGLLGTKDADLTTPSAIARSSGESFDPRRVMLLTKLYEYLVSLAPSFRKSENNTGRVLCFYESYFSNYIEGTTFTVEEASEIVFENKIPEKRPEDAHDISGTYNIVSSLAEMKKTPRTFDELIDLLKSRHKQIMRSRPNKNPGIFKTAENKAGSTLFVAPDLVLGTLKEGFKLYQKLDTPFKKAVFMMFMISEIHPFKDGNGRISRIMMNAELVSGGEQRIIIPTIYRDNYIEALKALSHNQITDSYVKMLDFAQRYTNMIDWSNLQTATDMLTATNAFSEEKDKILRLPTAMD
jgi:fido (protein-threonine AMPylation protein)